MGIENDETLDGGPKIPLSLKTPGGHYIERMSLVRCLIEGLKDLGFQVAAKALEEESHTTSQPVVFVKFREAVMKSDWKMAEELVLSSPDSISDSIQLEIRVLMGEQRFLEAVDAGNIAEALSVLRERLSPIHHSSQRLAFLSSMLMFPNPEVLRKQANWCGGEISREELVKAVQRLLPSAVPELRLFKLMDQALTQQVAKCVVHSGNSSFDLLRDHECELNAQDRCVAVLTEHTDEVNYVSFSPDFSLLASASKDKSVIIWDLIHETKVEPRRRFTLEVAAFILEWSPCSSLLLAASEFNVFCWNVESGAKKFELELEDITGCCWLPQTTGFVTGGGNGKISIWDLEGNMIHGWEEDVIRDVKVCAGDKPRLVAATEERILCYDLTQKEETARLELEDVTIMSLTVSADGCFAVAVCSDSVLHTLELVVVDLARASVICKLMGPTQSMYVIRCSFGGPEASFVLSGSEDSRVYVWQRSTGALLRTLDGHSAPVNHVAWSPRLVASCSDDRSIRLWGSQKTPVPTIAPLPCRTRIRNSEEA